MLQFIFMLTDDISLLFSMPIHTDKEEQWDEKIQRQLKASQRCTSS